MHETNDMGSGIASYDLWVQINGGPVFLWRVGITNACVEFTGSDGDTYAFFSIAHDNAGNVELPPSSPDATTTITLPEPLLVSISRSPLPNGQGEQIILTFPVTPGKNYTAEFRNGLSLAEPRCRLFLTIPGR